MSIPVLNPAPAKVPSAAAPGGSTVATGSAPAGAFAAVLQSSLDSSVSPAPEKTRDVGRDDATRGGDGMDQILVPGIFTQATPPAGAMATGPLHVDAGAAAGLAAPAAGTSSLAAADTATTSASTAIPALPAAGALPTPMVTRAGDHPVGAANPAAPHTAHPVIPAETTQAPAAAPGAPAPADVSPATNAVPLPGPASSPLQTGRATAAVAATGSPAPAAPATAPPVTAPPAGARSAPASPAGARSADAPPAGAPSAPATATAGVAPADLFAATLSGRNVPVADPGAAPGAAAGPAAPAGLVGAPPHTPPAPVAPAAPAASVAPAQPAPLAAQVAAPLFTLVGAKPGEHVLSINVTPDNLGPVTVRAHVSADGVRVELFAPNDAGRDALRAILPDLRRDLAGSGLNSNLDLSSQNQAPDPESAGRQTPAGRRGLDGGTAAEQPTGPAQPRGFGSSSTIDVLA
ncbi:flagellar hook-length control protein FliK [Glaciibacter sp. 2TAF33]|uniref:flagellar hook-length control protein FliK n=1 Tax=Glaciibacter sp. 2TAF33 TaxID=3233015 RepID=UPI003F8E79FC